LLIILLFGQVETGNPEAELAPAFATIGPVLEKFVSVDDMLVPVDDGKKSGVYVSQVCGICFFLLVGSSAIP
jgi:Rab GDP dissociation inhibitor